MTDQPTPIAGELAAMRRIVTALDGLDQRARSRVIGWLFARYEPDADLYADREDVTR